LLQKDRMNSTGHSAKTDSEETPSLNQMMLETGAIESPYEQLVNRKEFQRNLLENVRGCRTVVNSLKEDIKAINFAK